MVVNVALVLSRTLALIISCCGWCYYFVALSLVLLVRSLLLVVVIESC